MISKVLITGSDHSIEFGLEGTSVVAYATGLLQDGEILTVEAVDQEARDAFWSEWCHIWRARI